MRFWAEGCIAIGGHRCGLRKQDWRDALPIQNPARCLAWLLVGATAATTAHCASLPASATPLLQYLYGGDPGTPRLSLTRDVTLKLNIKEAVLIVANFAAGAAEGGRAAGGAGLRLQCPDLTACQVTVGSGDLEIEGFYPGGAGGGAGRADAVEPLTSIEQTLRIDDPQFVSLSPMAVMRGPVGRCPTYRPAGRIGAALGEHGADGGNSQDGHRPGGDRQRQLRCEQHLYRDPQRDLARLHVDAAL